MNKTIGFGGGCHWCTEAVFLSLKGVKEVKQGWIASQQPYEAFSEAVIVTYDPVVIALEDLIAIHLDTHASASSHSMRHKYRSAVYWFDAEDAASIQKIIVGLQPCFSDPVITQVLPFAGFKSSLPEHLDYYYSNPEKPFCTLYIQPKLELLKVKFPNLTRRAEKTDVSSSVDKSY